MNRPRVSVIVTSHNQLKYSKMMYASLLKYTDYPYELIWVDCISTDGTRKWLNSKIHEETLKVFVPKMGIGEAMNIGFKKCSPQSKYIGDLDNDLILTKGWLTKLVKHMEADSKIAACSALRTKDLETKFKPETEGNLEAEIQAFSKIIGEKKGVENRGHPNGSHTLYRRSAIEQVGLWDPRFWKGEDTDLSKRLRINGWKCMHASDTWVFHFKSVTTDEIDRTDADWRERRLKSVRLYRRLYARKGARRKGKR